MQFVSTKPFKDQLKDMCKFFADNFRRDEDDDEDSDAENEVTKQMKNFIKQKDTIGIIKYILSLKEELYKLPTSHR